MSYKNYLNKLCKKGDLSSLYNTDLFDYQFLKDFYIKSNKELQQEILNAKTNKGNNLFKISVIFEDLPFFKELFPIQKNIPFVIENSSLIKFFECAENHVEIEKFLTEKYTQKELNLTSINYADAFFEHNRMLISINRNPQNKEEIASNFRFKNLYKKLVNEIPNVWNDFNTKDKLKFLIYIENSLKIYNNKSILDDQINNILDLEKDKTTLVKFLIENDSLLAESYFTSPNISHNSKIPLEQINNELVVLFENIENSDIEKVIFQSKIINHKIGKFDLKAQDLTPENALTFKKMIACSYLLIELNESKNFSQNNFIRKLIRNYNIEPGDNNINSEYYEKQLEETNLLNLFIDKRFIYEGDRDKKNFSNYLLKNLDNFPSIYKHILANFPIFVDFDLNNSFFSLENSLGRVNEINNFPVSISVAEPRKDLLIHESTHVLQHLSRKCEKPLTKNEKWKEIKRILTEETNISKAELISSLNSLLQTEDETINKHLDIYMETNEYKYNEVLKIINKESYNFLVSSIFYAYREQVVNGKHFLPTLWNKLDSYKPNSFPYYGSVHEIHARLSEIAYAEDIVELDHKIITVGIKSGVIEKLRPLIEDLNNEIWNDVKDYMVVENKAKRVKP